MSVAESPDPATSRNQDTPLPQRISNLKDEVGRLNERLQNGYSFFTRLRKYQLDLQTEHQLLEDKCKRDYLEYTGDLSWKRSTIVKMNRESKFMTSRIAYLERSRDDARADLRASSLSNHDLLGKLIKVHDDKRVVDVECMQQISKKVEDLSPERDRLYHQSSTLRSKVDHKELEYQNLFIECQHFERERDDSLKSLESSRTSVICCILVDVLSYVTFLLICLFLTELTSKLGTAENYLAKVRSNLAESVNRESSLSSEV